ncbi:MAG: hypothetical protein WCP24_03500 [bacterium]
MIKISSIFVLGLLVALIPSTGFSMEWKNFFYIVFGLSIVVFSILIRRELHEVIRQLHNDREIKNDTFSQNSPEIKNNRKEEK